MHAEPFPTCWYAIIRIARFDEDTPCLQNGLRHQASAFRAAFSFLHLCFCVHSTDGCSSLFAFPSASCYAVCVYAGFAFSLPVPFSFLLFLFQHGCPVGLPPFSSSTGFHILSFFTFSFSAVLPFRDFLISSDLAAAISSLRSFCA